MARGWRERICPTCKAWPGEPCRTPSGREASQVHAARLRPGRVELLWGAAVWEELERRGATMAVVPFSGRAGQGGTTATIRLSRIEGGALGAANAVRQAHSKAIVVSASGDATEYHEMAKSSPYEEVAICRYLPIA